MFKLFKRHKLMFVVAFCDTPDLATKFGQDNISFDNYETALRSIKVFWPQAIKVQDDIYKVDGAYLIVTTDIR